MRLNLLLIMLSLDVSDGLYSEDQSTHCLVFLDVKVIEWRLSVRIQTT